MQTVQVVIEFGVGVVIMHFDLSVCGVEPSTQGCIVAVAAVVIDIVMDVDLQHTAGDASDRPGCCLQNLDRTHIAPQALQVDAQPKFVVAA